MRQWIGITMLAAVCSATTTTQADLQGYVDKPDDSYRYEIVTDSPMGLARGFNVKLTSQTWQGIAWEHWLSVLVPQNVRHPDKAILVIAGGSNGRGAPKGDSEEARMVALLAQQCGVTVAVLQQVPNQPLYGGLKEDALIAYTYEKYVDGEGEDWPLLLPMVKSAVRAMDTIQAVTKEKTDLDIEQFIVTGASKRGWTTWLTGASDDRVCGIMPMVIDMLNLMPQMRQQRQTYGTYSRMIQDYTERGLSEWLKSAEGKALVRLVDPFSYRDELTMPKLILLGANDPYWTVDAANLYFDELPDKKLLHYVPNAGHGLNATILPTVMGFCQALLNDTPLPALDWRRTDDNRLIVKWEQAGATATLWQAHADDRDFRERPWTATPLGGGKQVEVALETPDTGWTASYVQVQFPGQPPMTLSTTMTVLPERFPHEATAAAE